MIKYMLDTNLLIYTIKNRPKKVREAFKKNADYHSMCAVTLGLILVTNNMREFKRVPGLRVENWTR